MIHFTFGIMNQLFPDKIENVSSESEEAHVATFYVMQALTRMAFPETKMLKRSDVEWIRGDARYHVPYDEKEIRLWIVPIELPVLPPRVMKCKLPVPRQVMKTVTKPKIVTDISRLGFDLTQVQSFVFVPVTRLGFDCHVLESN
jgi:hypothetical protein